MKKISLLALLLALALLSSGCSLIVNDEAADNALVVLSVNGETMDKASMNAAIESEIAYNQQMNEMYKAYYGFDFGYPTDRAGVMDGVIDSQVSQMVARQMAHEMKLDEWTDAEKEEIQAIALSSYETQLEDIIYSIFPALPEDAAREKAIAYAASQGITEDALAESERMNTLFSKLQDEVTRDVTVSDADVEKTLTERRESDQSMFDSDPALFGEYLNNGYGRVHYAPTGYRMVKHILIAFTQEDAALIDEKTQALSAANAALGEATEADDTTLLQQQADDAQLALDEAKALALEHIRQKADEVYALITADNADVDALIAKYNEDPGAPQQGYALCEGYTGFVQPFTDAALALENVGDVSQPVATDYGYHILIYTADVPQGPYDETGAREEIREEMLTDAKNALFLEQVNHWVEEADVVIYKDRLN